MWSLDTRWFDVAVVMSMFAIGSILFGRFEEHKPRGRRVFKVAIVLAVTVALAEAAGRLWAYALLAVPLNRRRLRAPRLAAQAWNQRLDGRAAGEVPRVDGAAPVRPRPALTEP